MGQLKCKNEELRDHNVRLIGSQDNDKQIITLLKDKLSQLEAMMETKKGIMATKEEEWMNLKVKLELT